MRVQIIKVIHRTAGLTVNEDILFSGLWLPKPVIMTPSDGLFYHQNGQHLLYETIGYTLFMDLTESEIDVKNTQQSIARFYEIIFNTILFSSKKTQSRRVLSNNFLGLSFNT